MFFANDQRDKVREENPGISFGKSFLLLPITHAGQSQLTPHIGQVGKMLGDKWKALTETERKPYDAKAAADKKRYEEEKAKYNAVSSLSRVSMAILAQRTSMLTPLIAGRGGRGVFLNAPLQISFAQLLAFVFLFADSLVVFLRFITHGS
jgi:hypothetical protein